MSDIKWLPDGQETFDKMMSAVPADVREGAASQILAMLAKRTHGELVSQETVETFVLEDLPEPQRTVLSAALGLDKHEADEAPTLFAKVEWEAKGKVANPSDLKKIKEEGMELLVSSKTRITVGGATCGLAKGSQKTFSALKRELKKKGIEADVVMVGSNGMSYAEPVVDVIRAGRPRITYGNVGVDRVKDIVDSVSSDKVVEDLALTRRDIQKSEVVPDTLKYIKGEPDNAFSAVTEYRNLPFFKKQMQLLTRNAGTISPDRIEEYIALGGYSALAKALTSMKPGDIINEVKVSKLRGRGGAGFPTGTKWRACRSAKGDKKYIVCNGSEGDPEIGMHKSFLESDPHAVIEGMIIAGYALGADQGYVYLNDRYLLAIERVKAGINQAETMGLLGDNIMNTGFSFSLKIKRGGGAYICGEETALLNSLEGSFGEPRPRPPLPVEKGLFGKPTVVNNLETIANVPMIVLKRGKWFAGIGTPSSKGTKIIALSGNVAQPCWVEVPLGTNVEDIINTFGGGTDSGKAIKAFQTGGPSGGILPAKLLNINLDYNALAKAGTMLGSGGLLVMDEDTDLVDMAKFFTDFFAEESCGKCAPCRYGMPQLQNLVNRFVDGRGTPKDLTLIKRMGDTMSDGCFCALGKSSAAPFIDLMDHFPEEIERRMLKPIN